MKSIVLLSSILLLVLISAVGCEKQHAAVSTVSSTYPVAVDSRKVGKYPVMTKSGGGYFYDDVLEYRVWVHPRFGGDDEFQAFPTYEAAQVFSAHTDGAESPLVLVRQYEWIDEPDKHKYIVKKGERITEWCVEWLKGKKRQPDSIAQFLQKNSAQQ